MDNTTLFLICLVAVACVLFWLLYSLLGGRRDTIEERLIPGARSSDGPTNSPMEDFSQLLYQVGQTAGKALQPKTEEDRNELRRRLGYAGIYSRAGMTTFIGGRVMALVTGLVGGAICGTILMGGSGLMIPLLLGAVGGLGGYLFPTFWLDWRVSHNRTSLDHALPDALDLLVVCVESGLAVDAAFQRVGSEIALTHPALAREFATAHLETQMGVSRNDSLRNIYRRTGSESIQSLACMLIQAERFGTSIGQALRVYSDSLRIKRRYKAEEKAATAAVKITFPLVLFVFPALLIVIGGPAVLRIKDLNVF